jgi:hypothetical protein
MLAETMADVKAGRMDPKVAKTFAYLGTVLLRAYEADATPAPTRPDVPLVYRSLMLRDGLEHEPDDVMDLYPSKPAGLPAAEVPCALPAPTPSAAPTEIVRPREEIEIEILGY